METSLFINYGIETMLNVQEDYTQSKKQKSPKLMLHAWEPCLKMYNQPLKWFWMTIWRDFEHGKVILTLIKPLPYMPKSYPMSLELKIQDQLTVFSILLSFLYKKGQKGNDS